MTNWLVTVNLGGDKQSAQRRAGMRDWTERILADGERRPVVIFAQEVFTGWLDLFSPRQWVVTLGTDQGWQVRSAVVTSRALAVTRVDDRTVSNLHYHGNYMAVARWERPGQQDIILASVHASPNEADPEKYEWRGPLPEPRHGGRDERYVGSRLWDSDLLLATLRDLHSTTGLPVLAGGDLNESLLYDFDTSGRQLGTWGKEYFELAHRYGLIPWLHKAWADGNGHSERPTRGLYQLDHLLTTADAAELLGTEPLPHVDQEWKDRAALDSLSDHAPVWTAFSESLNFG